MSEFFGSQDFKERTLRRGVLCSDLCSSSFHSFPINKFWCMAVFKTDILMRCRESGLLSLSEPQHFEITIETRGILNPLRLDFRFNAPLS